MKDNTYKISLAVHRKCPDKVKDALDGWVQNNSYNKNQLGEYIKDHHPEVWQKILPEVTKIKLKGDSYETE